MKSTSVTYRAIKAILTVVGQIELHGCPIPFLKNARGFDICGAEQRAVMDLLKPGDVMLGRYTNHLTSVLIPGHFDHAAIYVGNNKVVHITGDGVSEQDVLEFMERDGVAVLRLDGSEDGYDEYIIAQVIADIARCYLDEGRDYDYLFDFEDNSRFSCSELVQSVLEESFERYHVMPHVDIDLKRTWTGKLVYTPDDLFNSGLTVIHESKAWRKARKEQNATGQK